MKSETTDFDSDALTLALLPAVIEAGRVEMAYFNAGVEIERKADKSPVTVADREAEAIIVASLMQAPVRATIVAEEAVAAGHYPAPAKRYFLVDALDGTRLFIKGKPEFSINIALVDDGRPVYGLIYGPATGKLYVTRSDGTSASTAIAPGAAPETIFASLTTLRTKPSAAGRLIAFNSSTSGERAAGLLKELGVAEAQPFGSSLKFCRIAAGEGDLYVRLGDTNEWDTAAGQCILEAAGGSVATLDGRRLSYGDPTRKYLNPQFIAWAGAPLRVWPDSGGELSGRTAPA